MKVYKGILQETNYEIHTADFKKYSLLFTLKESFEFPHLIAWLSVEQFDKLEKLGIRVGARCLIEIENHSKYRVIF